MRRVNSGDLDRLSYKSGGGCIGLFGLPFLCAGLFMFIMALSGNVKVKGGGTAGAGQLVFMALFSLPFIAIGAALVLGRGGIIFEKTARTVTTWWGLLFPFKSTVRNLSEFVAVTISREERRSKNGTYIVYPIRLKAKAGKDVDIDTSQNEQAARQTAEEVAKFIDFGIVDSSSGERVERDAGKLDESLRERMARKHQEVSIDAPPQGMRSTYSAEGDRVTFEIPPPGFNFASLLPIGCMGAFALWVFYGALTSATSTFPRWAVIAVILGIFVLVPLLGVLISTFSNRGCTVEASPDGLRMTSKGAFFNRTRVISSDDLEELRVKSSTPRNASAIGPCLEAVSDKQFARFGNGLPREELEWIRAVILKAVTK
jgi:hypothetical protein